MQQVVMPEVAHVALAAKRHRRVQLAINDVESLFDASLAERAETVNEGATDIAAPGTEAKRLEHVLARANTAVEMNFDIAADLGDDGRQRADRRLRAV